ncbi:hypothetical protein V1264_013861 [Littorina saxatilis]|uniref:Uncharacterized protein n=2 Tax=Littorina saxatilis TaxID=31220 RepID=A0AAN9BQP9_9CAEN
MGEEAAAKFINALIKSVQTLCHGYLDFQTGIEIIGHINLSVDKENSLDYILKEKVCKNAENSTLFISHSFHAEPKSEQEVPVKNAQAGNQNVQSRQPTDSGESGRVSSALSSISSALSGSRERSRQSNTKDSGSPHSYQSTAKRKASDDSGSEVRPSKVSSHHDSISHTSSDSAFPPTSSSPVDSKQSLRHLRTSDDNMSQTMLPQTANFTSDNAADIGVNLAGSVLEPVDDQSNPDLPERDDESDGDLEVTFIKEEYMEGERSACEFENSGQQFVGGPHRRASEGMPDPSLYPVALHGSSASATYVPSAHDQQFQPGSLGPSTSQPQPGPSGMRGISGVQSFVNSLSAFGSLGAPGLPLARTHGLPDHSTQNSVLPGAPGSHLSFHCPKPGYSSSHMALQRAFALYRDDKRKKGVSIKEEELKTEERLDLMSAGYRQLLEHKGGLTLDYYKRAIEKEKRRVAKKAYRATLSEIKKSEIKEKDKERKRMRRSLSSAAGVDVSNIMQQFSFGFSDNAPGLGSNSADSASGIDHPSGGHIPGVDASTVGHIQASGMMSSRPEMESGMAGNTSDTNSSTVESSSWIDSVSFDTCAQEQEDGKSDGHSKISNEQSNLD